MDKSFSILFSHVVILATFLNSLFNYKLYGLPLFYKKYTDENNLWIVFFFGCNAK